MRRRPVATPGSNPDVTSDGTASEQPRKRARGDRVGTPVVLVAAFSLVVFAAMGRALLASFPTTSRHEPSTPTTLRAVTPEELAENVGSPPGSPVWIALLGEVFDVTSGARHYGPEGGYRFFAGTDATRAFHTGEFTEEGLVPSVDGLSDAAMLGLEEWAEFYRGGGPTGDDGENEREYKRVGFLVGGHYYLDDDPSSAPYAPTPSPAKLAFDEAVRRARVEKKKAAARDATFPACASRWSSDRGGEVFCEDGRGRPRKEVTFAAGKRRVRCACFPEESFSDVRQLYAGCDKTATRCTTG